MISDTSDWTCSQILFCDTFESDLDVIDPLVAPGVSVKANDGINEREAYKIMDELLDRIDKIKSFDLVELNPDNDIDNKTKIIAENILEKLIKKNTK